MARQRRKKLTIRPFVDQKFNQQAAEELMQKIMVEELSGTVYDSSRGSEIAKNISRKVHDAMRGLLCDMYKIAIHVVLGEKQGQGVRCQSGCLWDDDTDSLTSVSLNQESLYCIITVFAVYCYNEN